MVDIFLRNLNSFRTMVMKLYYIMVIILIRHLMYLTHLLIKLINTKLRLQTNPIGM